MIGNPRPAPAPTLAWVWRKSWRRTACNPARFATALHGRCKSARGFSQSTPADLPAITNDPMRGRVESTLVAGALSTIAFLPGLAVRKKEKSTLKIHPVPAEAQDFS